MTNDKTTNILFCGTGGQGVLKAAEVTGWAALFAGFHAKKSEVHGMAQRGGSVESHLRFGKEVFSPLIPKGECDILVSFHSGEEERMRSFLKTDGINLHNHLISFHKKALPPMFLNTFLLGVLAAHVNIPKDAWMKALEQEFNNKKLEENIKVFLDGWGDTGL
jgi:indolepyruvate ferredoxin oxidoreductase beta subunit